VHILLLGLMKERVLILPEKKSRGYNLHLIQGLPSGFDIMYLAVADRNMQVNLVWWVGNPE
jgi:hypothetical protein